MVYFSNYYVIPSATVYAGSLRPAPRRPTPATLNFAELDGEFELNLLADLMSSGYGLARRVTDIAGETLRAVAAGRAGAR
jgi:hypothetical protein